MSESDGGSEIIIKGGSVHVQFNSSGYTKDPGDPSKHEHRNKKITKIVVHDDKGNEKLSIADAQGGLKWTVTVTTE